MDDLHEQPALRKRDIPFWMNGKLVVCVMAVALQSITYGVLTDPAFRDGRPGILNGLFAVALGVVVGRAAGKRAGRHFQRELLDTKNSRRLIRTRPPRAGDVLWILLCFAVSAVSAAFGVLLWSKAGLRMPWCGDPQSSMAVGFLSCCVAFWWSYAKWHDTLPDQHHSRHS